MTSTMYIYFPTFRFLQTHEGVPSLCPGIFLPKGSFHIFSRLGQLLILHPLLFLSSLLFGGDFMSSLTSTFRLLATRRLSLVYVHPFFPLLLLTIFSLFYSRHSTSSAPSYSTRALSSVPQPPSLPSIFLHIFFRWVASSASSIFSSFNKLVRP